jgi:hypothetical protein
MFSKNEHYSVKPMQAKPAERWLVRSVAKIHLECVVQLDRLGTDCADM